MDLADVVLILGIIAINIGITIYSYAQKVRYLLFIPALLWFTLSIWSWGRTDPLSITTYDIFFVVRWLGISMSLASFIMVGTFGEHQALTWSDEDEDETAVYEAKDRAAPYGGDEEEWPKKKGKR